MVAFWSKSTKVAFFLVGGLGPLGGGVAGSTGGSWGGLGGGFGSSKRVCRVVLSIALASSSEHWCLSMILSLGQVRMLTFCSGGSWSGMTQVLVGRVCW